MERYKQTIRVKRWDICPYYNDLTPSECKKWVQTFMPECENKFLATAYMEAAKCANKALEQVVDIAFLLTFGHKSRHTMYRISGVWREEFTNEQKKAIRHWLDLEARLLRIAALHNNCLRKADKVL